MAPYAPILMNSWGLVIDSNFFLTKEALVNTQSFNIDKHSTFGAAKFLNVINGDYQGSNNARALKTVFKNFDRNAGVTLPALKRIAAKPPIKPLLSSLNEIKGIEVEWLGAKFKNIETLGEKSAAGLHDNNGTLLVQLPATSLAAKSKLQKGDVIIKMGDQDINSISDLLKTYQTIKWMGQSVVIIIRNQATQNIELSFK